MPKFPETMTKANYSGMSTMDIVNTVRAAAAAHDTFTGVAFDERIPECNKNNLDQVAQILYDNGELRNAFMVELFNRVGLVDMNYRRYMNPLKRLRRGFLQFGESVEEIVFGLIKGRCDWNIEDGVTDVFEIVRPMVNAAIHKINFKMKYPMSVAREELRAAMLSASGLGSFLDGLMTVPYNSYELDEQLAYKNLVKAALNAGYGVVNTSGGVTNKQTAEDFTTEVIALTTFLTNMRTDNNGMGWPTFTPAEDMVLIMDARLNAVMKVQVLASAFNMSEVEFIQAGIKIVIDEFPVKGVRAVLCDKRFFQIFDNDFSMESMYNGSNRVTNYFLHVWEVISASPFVNAIFFIDGREIGTLTSFTLKPQRFEPTLGNPIPYVLSVKPEFTGTGVFDHRLVWSITGNVDPRTYVTTWGYVVLFGEDRNSPEKITVTAKSFVDESITATVTLNPIS